nr:hypothetical protein [Rubellimicrobium aerolatum]
MPPAGYRQRRLRDAARLLPVAGIVLLLIPLLWKPSGTPQGVGNAAALLYVFGVWAALVAGARLLAWLLRLDAEEEGGEGPP